MVRILVIDDCHLLVSALKQALNSAGYVVLGTSSSREAIELLQRESVQLVITDLHMPAPDDVELLRWAGREKPAIPFIVFSGHVAPRSLFREVRSLGAVFTLQKPMTTGRLLESVEAALDRNYGSQILPATGK